MTVRLRRRLLVGLAVGAGVALFAAASNATVVPTGAPVLTFVIRIEADVTLSGRTGRANVSDGLVSAATPAD